MLKHFELLNPEVVLLFKSLGIDYMSIIQKPQRITPKIKKVEYNNTNNLIYIIINDELCVILRQNIASLENSFKQLFIKQGGKKKSKNKTKKSKNKIKKSKKSKKSRKAKRKNKKTTRKRNQQGGNIDNLKQIIILFIAMFSLIIMTLNQNLIQNSNKFISRQEYKDYLDNFDPTDINKYIDKHFLEEVDENSTELIAHWKSDGIINMTTPASFSVKEAPIVATLDFRETCTNQFMQMLEDEDLFFKNPDYIGDGNTISLPVQGLQRYFRVNVKDGKAIIEKRAKSHASSSDEDIEKRRFYNLPETSTKLNNIIDKTVKEQIEGILNTANMISKDDATYWVQLNAMKLQETKGYAAIIQKILEYIFQIDKHKWHVDEIPFLKRLGPLRSNKGIPYDMSEALQQSYSDRDPDNVTPFQGLMTMTYGKGIYQRSKAKIVNKDEESFIIENDENTFPLETTRVYQTGVQNSDAIALHSVADTKQTLSKNPQSLKRPVAQLIIVRETDSTALNTDEWVPLKN